LCRSNRPKRSCTVSEAYGSPMPAKFSDKKDLLTHSIPKEVSLLRRAGPYLIG